jgi:hypothetical protein
MSVFTRDGIWLTRDMGPCLRRGDVPIKIQPSC